GAGDGPVDGREAAATLFLPAPDFRGLVFLITHIASHEVSGGPAAVPVGIGRSRWPPLTTSGACGRHGVGGIRYALAPEPGASKHSTMHGGRQLLGLAAWLGLTFAAATLGAAATLEAATFYQGLARPSWAPPGW